MEKRSNFTGKIGYVLAAAGASVGLGNIWRFPYLAAKYGGGIFLLVYILLAITFGYTMIIAETAIGRKTGKSPVGAFRSLGKHRVVRFGGWINAIIPILIVPYYSVIGGWVCKYLYEFIAGNTETIIKDNFFTTFISSGIQTEFWFICFSIAVLLVIFLGVENGIEKVSKFMMPVLVLLSIVICVYSISRPNALGGVLYFLIPDFRRFSVMTVVSALGQMFYSLSIAMGILITFGSYMKKEISIEQSTQQVEIFDTAVAILAGLIIIPAVFSFSNGDTDALNAGPSLMFITMPKIFYEMGLGRIIGILFFVLVLFAALTSAIALTESAVSTFVDEFGWKRSRSILVISIIILVLGSLSSLGYGPLANIKILGMPFLDFFDFITNSVMMPIAAMFICLLVSRDMSIEEIDNEVSLKGQPFRRKRTFKYMIHYIAPLFVLIILFSAVANVMGWIQM